MFAIHLIKNFEHLHALGLARSQRHYARVWLGRGPHYLRDVANRDRGWHRSSTPTVARLRARLLAVAAKVPGGVAAEIRAVIAELDRDTCVAITMISWGR